MRRRRDHKGPTAAHATCPRRCGNCRPIDGTGSDISLSIHLSIHLSIYLSIYLSLSRPLQFLLLSVAPSLHSPYHYFFPLKKKQVKNLDTHTHPPTQTHGRTHGQTHTQTRLDGRVTCRTERRTWRRVADSCAPAVDCFLAGDRRLVLQDFFFSAVAPSLGPFLPALIVGFFLVSFSSFLHFFFFVVFFFFPLFDRARFSSGSGFEFLWL